MPNKKNKISDKELLVTDPTEGLWVISENKPSVQIKHIVESDSFGKVKCMALSSNGKLLVLYS